MEFRNLLNSRIYDAGGKADENGVITYTPEQFKAGARAALKQFEALLPLKMPANGVRLVDASDFGIMEMLDALVLDPMRKKRMHSEVASILGGRSAHLLYEAINTTQFPRMLNRLASVAILDGYEMALENVDALVTEVNDVKTSYYKTNLITSQDSPSLTAEGAAYEETVLGELEVDIKLRKYGRLLKITREMVLADETGKVLDQAKNNGEYMALIRQQDILGVCTGQASIVYDGASTDNFIVNGTGFDLFSNDHSAIPGQGAQANDNLIAAALGSAGIQTAITALREIKDIHGRRIKVMPKQLIHAAAQEFTAQKLFSFVVEPALTTSGQDPNLFKSKYMPVLDMEGTDGTWYLGDFSKQVVYAWGWKPEVESDTNPGMKITNDIVVLIRPSFKGGAGCRDYKYAVKSIAP